MLVKQPISSLLGAWFLSGRWRGWACGWLFWAHLGSSWALDIFDTLIICRLYGHLRFPALWTAVLLMRSLGKTCCEMFLSSSEFSLLYVRFQPRTLLLTLKTLHNYVCVMYLELSSHIQQSCQVSVVLLGMGLKDFFESSVYSGVLKITEIVLAEFVCF